MLNHEWFVSGCWGESPVAWSTTIIKRLAQDIDRCEWFSIQCDKTVDPSKTAQLAVYVQMVFDDFSTKEESLTLLPLKSYYTAFKYCDLLSKLGQEFADRFNDFEWDFKTDGWTILCQSCGDGGDPPPKWCPAKLSTAFTGIHISVFVWVYLPFWSSFFWH